MSGASGGWVQGPDGTWSSPSPADASAPGESSPSPSGALPGFGPAGPESAPPPASLDADRIRALLSGDAAASEPGWMGLSRRSSRQVGFDIGGTLSRVRSIMTTLTVAAMGGLATVIGRGLFVPGSEGVAVMVTGLATCILAAAALVFEGSATPVMPWAGRVLGLGAGVALTSSSFAVVLGEPFGPVALLLVWAAWSITRFWARLTLSVESTAERLGRSFTNRVFTATFSDEDLTPEARRALAEALQSGRGGTEQAFKIFGSLRKRRDA